MNPDKALASGCEEGGWLIRAWIQGRMHEVRIGCRNLAKGAMRHFRKIANRAINACAGKIFVKITEKIFGEIVLGKIW